jgi:hypothetical protein
VTTQAGNRENTMHTATIVSVLLREHCYKNSNTFSQYILYSEAMWTVKKTLIYIIYYIIYNILLKVPKTPYMGDQGFKNISTVCHMSSTHFMPPDQ